MKRYVVTLNYEIHKPVGFLLLDDDLPEEVLVKCVIAPKSLVTEITKEPYKVIEFGMFDRNQLDTRPMEAQS